jgi:translocator assembly and maintenance protein 41
LNQLPRAPLKAIVRLWNRDSGKLRQDTEDALRAIAYDPDCGMILLECIKDIVWASSIRQSLKGILTAGVVKSLQYGGKKIMKMIKS